jgi:hypothetical protein
VAIQKMCLNKMPLLDERDPKFHQVEQRSRLVANLDAALAEVAQGGAVVLTAQLVLEHFVQRSQHLRDSVRVQSEDVAMSPVGIFTRKGDPILPRINKVLSNLKAAGLIHKLERDAASKLREGKRRSSLTPSTIRATHLTGAFALLMLGLATALVIFMFERCWSF